MVSSWVLARPLSSPTIGQGVGLDLREDAGDHPGSLAAVCQIPHLDEIEDLAVAPLEVVVVLVDVGLLPKPLLFLADAGSLNDERLPVVFAKFVETLDARELLLKALNCGLGDLPRTDAFCSRRRSPSRSAALTLASGKQASKLFAQGYLKFSSPNPWGFALVVRDPCQTLAAVAAAVVETDRTGAAASLGFPINLAAALPADKDGSQRVVIAGERSFHPLLLRVRMVWQRSKVSWSTRAGCAPSMSSPSRRILPR